MPVVDVHAHIYPDKIAAKATHSIGDFYILPTFGEGSGQHLIDITAESPITHFLVHSVAVKPGTVESINTFIANQCAMHPEFTGFASMNQDYEDMEAEINRAISLGLKGVKIHPDIQKCNVDDPRFMKLFEIIEGRIPATIHTGDYRYDYSHPRRLRKVLKTFPNLVVDAAHMGGWSVYDIGFDWLHDLENCYVDTSSSLLMVGQRHLRELANMYGTERVMFGTDYPLGDPIWEIEQVLGAGFSEDTLENILWHNMERFANVKIS